MSVEIEYLKKIRASLKGSMTKLVNYVNSLTNASEQTIDDFKIRIERAQELFKSFIDIEKQIFHSDSKEDSGLTAFEDNYYMVIASLNGWIRRTSVIEAVAAPNDTLNLTTGCSRNPVEVKLPKINITPFTGEYKDWQTFFDLFSSTIHEKEYLSSAQKFQYLKSLLKGDAERLLRNTNITEANYNEALQKLIKRYDKKRHTVNSHIESFLKQATITNASAANIRAILDTSDEAIRGLKCLGAKAELRDPWLIYILLNKLDADTRTLWSRFNTIDKEFPTLQEFFEFLEARTDSLESLSACTSKRFTPTIFPQKLQKSNSFVTSTTINCCPICKTDEHKLFDCEKFKTKTIEEREQLIKCEHRCFNCLNFNHNIYNCKSRMRCRECGKKHHTLLHKTKANTPCSSTATVALVGSGDSGCLNGLSQTHVILPTANVSIKGKDGEVMQYRALLDSASQESFITEDCIQSLGLQRKNSRLAMKGLGDSNLGQSQGKVALEIIAGTSNKQKFEVEAFIVPKIAVEIPAKNFDTADWEQIAGLDLADPKFNRRNSVDVLLGTEVYYKVTGGKRIFLKNNLVAEQTTFGWVIAGRCIEQQQQSSSFNVMLDIDASLRKFWETESLPDKSIHTEEEIKCERWFAQTTKKSSDGKFLCQFPFREETSKLGSTLWLAVSRQKAMERRFARDPKFKALYIAFMREYEQLGHMERIEPNQNKQYYLPHHGVLKEASSTTKLRVVFDASAKSSSGLSLNNILCVGPVVQSSLMDILLRFRQHRYVLTGDVEKMYRQVLMTEKDCAVQNIVWRDDTSQPLNHYRLKTLTYGTAPASFIATRCLKELSISNKDISPAAAKAIERDFYVDDLMTGAGSVEELINLKESITSILASANFKLRKWASNEESVRDQFVIDSSITNIKHIAENPEAIKILGLAWNAKTDSFYFLAKFESKEKHTKRTLLSEASKTFDPLGWLAPTVVRIKILFQTLWMQEIGWDDPLPQITQRQWEEIRNDLPKVSNIKMPRWFGSRQIIQLHGFCDTSQWAYAAAIYCRSVDCGVVETRLIASKTKVAPIKQLSIPRLELNGAVLLAKLMNAVIGALDLQIDRVVCWTDSKIVLAWLSSHSRRWSTFVANRTSSILDDFRREHWRHVISAENPADCASRGITATELLTHRLWWYGPDWLRAHEEEWPAQEEQYISTEEIKCETAAFQVTTHKEILGELAEKYSSYRKMNSIVAWVLKFQSNCLLSKCQRKFGELKVIEIENASNIFCKYVQKLNFNSELESLKRYQQDPKESKLKSLNPFLDENGIMRVGGRIRKSFAPYITKHPVILPQKSAITTAIVQDYHKTYYHAGIGLMMSLLRQKWWILRAKDVVKGVVRKCTHCVKQKPILENQIMGDVPLERVSFDHAFTCVSIDYAGPFKVTPIRRRGQQSFKAYMCIFVCLSTRAVHIENVGNLTSENFLAALSRFTDRRGLCTKIFSDNGTNFVGAYRHLTELFSFLNKQNANISLYLLRKEITWHFNPPGAPHMNGLAEAAVKSAKTYIKKAVGETILSLEEFNTLLTGIEGILNARPLCANISDEGEVLTPAHYLIGRTLHTLPEEISKSARLSPSTRWDLVKKLRYHFWVRWHLDYLTTLQGRNKWKDKQANLQLNDVVILKKESMASVRWVLGKVVELHPGSDDSVRVVSIKTATGILRRPIHKLCKLPVS